MVEKFFPGFDSEQVEPGVYVWGMSIVRQRASPNRLNAAWPTSAPKAPKAASSSYGPVRPC